MLRTRVIPVLLIQDGGLYKTQRFKDPKYVGDPINAVKIFNEKEVDEIIVLDISATRENRGPDFNLIADIATECFMPFCYGGGVKSIEQMKRLFSLGAEKIALNTSAVETPHLIQEAAKLFGAQAIVASIDVKKSWLGKYEVFTRCGQTKIKQDPVSLAQELEKLGAGEIMINSIDHDGLMTGYDLKLIKSLTDAVRIPVIACGGAGSVEHFHQAVKEAGASAVAAGSMFVFHGKHRAVLITYPEPSIVESIGR
jgi:cyclase